jgi:hypothetical protein
MTRRPTSIRSASACSPRAFQRLHLALPLLHRSIARTAADAPECWLERYYQQALDQGGRVRERLRDGVEQALLILGNGFLAQRGSEALRARLKSELPAPAYYRQLLRLVYRLLFLMVSEERGLVGPRRRRRPTFTALLRRDALARSGGGVSGAREHGELWEGLKQTSVCTPRATSRRGLGMARWTAISSGRTRCRIWRGPRSPTTSCCARCGISRFYRDERILRRVNYAALDVENSAASTRACWTNIPSSRRATAA